jgi:hypothetical protein
VIRKTGALKPFDLTAKLPINGIRSEAYGIRLGVEV